MSAAAASKATLSSSMTQDLIEWGSDDDGDDVQVILAALQSRKEKQQKLKKSIRDKANRSQQLVKQESEVQDRHYLDLIARMQHGVDELAQACDRPMPSIPPASTKEQEAELIEARQRVVDLGTQVLVASNDALQRFGKKALKVRHKIDLDSKRSRNEALVEGLMELRKEIDESIATVGGGGRVV